MSRKRLFILIPVLQSPIKDKQEEKNTDFNVHQRPSRQQKKTKKKNASTTQHVAKTKNRREKKR
jgi:hypothetical protein